MEKKNWKYFTHYFQTQNKNLLLITITKVVALRLSQHACTIHTQFKILIHGYIYVLPQLSDILQTLKYAHVIIIDEMSMKISIILCAIKQHLKQAQSNINLFVNVLLLLGDLAQLSTICRHSLKKKILYYNICHISLAPCWSMATRCLLISFTIHSIDPIFLQILNNIHFKHYKMKLIKYCKVVMFQKRICYHTFIMAQFFYVHIKEIVNKYNDFLIHKIFPSNEFFDVTMETNTLDIENVNTRLHDPKFNHIKYVAIGAIVMLTENINILKGVVNGTIVMITSIGFNNNNKMVTNIRIKKFNTNMFLTLKR